MKIENLRFYIQIRFKLGISVKTITDELKTALPDNAPSLRTVCSETFLSRGTIFNIIHNCLKLKKITSRWVPHELTQKNRNDRMRICQENLEKFKSTAWRLCDVITGDESWFYQRQIGRKQSNASWVKNGEPARTVVRRDRYEPKFMFTIFFKSNGPVHISYLDKGKTIDNNSYIKDSLKPIIAALKKQRNIGYKKHQISP